MDTLIAFFHGQSPLLILAFEFMFLFCSPLLLHGFFGARGLLVYVTAMGLVCNIQLLKVVQFSIINFPIPLGTPTFVSIVITLKILNEVYGRKAAQSALYLSAVMSLLFCTSLFITTAYTPTSSTVLLVYKQVDMHSQIKEIFTPLIGLYLSSLVAYLVSEWIDIHLFTKMKKHFQKKLLWLRINISGLVASILDNSIYYALIFFVLGQKSMEINIYLYSYVLSSLVLRISFSFLFTPVIYLSKRWNGK